MTRDVTSLPTQWFGNFFSWRARNYKVASHTFSVRGFTPIGFVLAVSLFFFTVTGAFAFVSHSWREARDGVRIQDVQTIAVALEKYRADHASYPREEDGVNGVLSPDSRLYELLAPYVPAVPHDPEGEDHRVYAYYYDAKHECGERVFAAVFARRMDLKSNSNFTELITGPCEGHLDSDGRMGGTDSYTILLGPLGDTD